MLLRYVICYVIIYLAITRSNVVDPDIRVISGLQCTSMTFASA